MLLNHGETKKKAGRKKTARKIISKIDAMKPKKPPPAFFYFLYVFRLSIYVEIMENYVCFFFTILIQCVCGFVLKN